MSNLPPDPWMILGIDKSADKGEIRTAYRKLVLKCHPDKIQDPTLKAQKQDEFQRVQQAYERLNDDVERQNYEDQVRLRELRKQTAAMMNSKTTANSSAPRTTHRYANVEIRTADPSRYKAPPPPTPPSTTPKMASTPKMPSYSSSHSRSQEEMPTRSYPSEEEERRYARRAASYDTPKFTSSRKEEEKREREERRRKRREEEDREIERQEKARERARLREEQERIARKEQRAIEKAQYERDQKQRDKERKAKSDDKAHRTKQQEVYVEPIPHEEEVVYAPKSEKRSNSRKQPELTREKSSSRRSERERNDSPKRDEPKRMDQYIGHAINYIERSRGTVPPTFSRSQSSQEPVAFARPMAVPTPPPAEEFVEDNLQKAALRAAASRRSSHDVPKSKDKAKKSSRDYAEIIDVTPGGKSPLVKSMTMPVVPETPTTSSPRVSRTHANSQDTYTRPMAMAPSLSRGQTWTAGDEERSRRGSASYGTDEHEDILPVEDRRSGRRRRNHSPEHYSPRTQTTSYRVDGGKTSKMDSIGYGYGGVSPSSGRYHTSDFPETRAYPLQSSSYVGGFRVKQAKDFDYSDVKYSAPYVYDVGDYHTSDYPQATPA